MIVYLLVTALTVLMAYFVNSALEREVNTGWQGAGRRRTRSRQGVLNGIFLIGIFVILFSLSALRIGIGNDYWVYRYQFLHIISGDTKVSYEIGFKLLVKVLQALFGYDNYRVVFAFMAFVTCALFVRGLFDNADWFVMSFFVFMANGFYFMSFSNVRYYFVVAICIYSLKFLFARKYVQFISWIIFAAFFHKSVLLVIPVYIVAYYLKWSKKNLWLIPAACGVLILGRPLVRRLIFTFYPFYEGDLILDVVSVSYINIIKCLAVLIFAMLYYKKAIRGNPRAETFFNLNLFALICYSFGYYIPVLSRVCYYMVLGHVFLIPGILMAIEKKWQRIFFLCAVTAAYTVYLVVFLIKSRDPGVLLLPYMTWLFT